MTSAQSHINWQEAEGGNSSHLFLRKSRGKTQFIQRLGVHAVSAILLSSSVLSLWYGSTLLSGDVQVPPVITNLSSMGAIFAGTNVQVVCFPVLTCLLELLSRNSIAKAFGL